MHSELTAHILDQLSTVSNGMRYNALWILHLKGGMLLPRNIGPEISAMNTVLLVERA
jgi:hypothetical protein